MELRSKRVVVTGADGFIGSHLVELLVEAGSHVTALSQYNSFNDWGWLEQITCLPLVQVVTGDVRDPHFCYGLMKGAEVIFHLAALIPIPYSYVAPSSYVETNVKGTLNVCQAGLAHGVGKIVHVSTSEVYGTAQYVPIDESHPLNPQSPYSATKVGADAIARSFHCSFGLPVAIARPFNAYGPRQSARAVIPSIISQIAAGEKRIKLGDVHTTRDFTFVKDTCLGLIAIACMDEPSGEVFHIGSNFEISIASLFSSIADLMHSDAQIEFDAVRQRPAKSEVTRLWCNNKRLRDATGFVPETTLRDGLSKTVAWFRDPANLRRYKTHLYNV
ncbi:MAG TPA: GDP-mannose 4,6-dehydratase [Bryobacteraceae bacterium]|jgi:NAD dependent epimerase/dehydratase|nr:GDP-mannose 4,6-dehydratase [Bryobacteraceae bacterium]